MYSRIYAGIMGASTVAFSGAGIYHGYQQSKDFDLINNIGQTSAGCIVGGLIGIGIGAVWPISVGVFIARKMAHTKD